ncbi:MAG: heavy metal translocating P-type ATPase metal-binding domain-containing protein [Cyclobacteriaceae bacterium]
MESVTTTNLAPVTNKLACYHCGQPCEDEVLKVDDKSFCCLGCKTVFEILSENNLGDYYKLQSAPGQQQLRPSTNFEFLDNEEVRQKLIEFESEGYAKVTLTVPAIHCASCLWLLENLYRINRNIFRTEVNFPRKRVTLFFNPKGIDLKGVVQLLDKIGYPPHITLNAQEEQQRPSYNKKLLLKLGVAAFAFGNIMLLSFPEYLGLAETEQQFKWIFSLLNIALSLPVVFYSAWDYFTSAWKSFRIRQINLDVPLAIGIAALFLRSLYDIYMGTGPGYLDSLAGLLFFLLTGRWFQNLTYENLAFDRDYKAFFPLAVSVESDQGITSSLVVNLQKDHVMLVRNQEIVPADSDLLDEEALVDYSFVTGEARPVLRRRGEHVYAGGRIVGKPARLMVTRRVSQGHLTSLWNNEVFRKSDESRYKRMIDRTATRFTWVILSLAVGSAIFWYLNDASQVWLVVSSILIVACPCALALSAPFTYGNMLRVFGNHHFYLKNADVIERMAQVDGIVFDKTGTITNGSAATVSFKGQLNDGEQELIRALTAGSAHPLSTLIHRHLEGVPQGAVTLNGFNEVPGAGVEGMVNGHHVRIGSGAWLGMEEITTDVQSTRVYASIDGIPKGYFAIGSRQRPGLSELLQKLGKKSLALLSGDNTGDRERMSAIFPQETELRFNQGPQEKLDYIRQQQDNGRHVMMIGDGLNDSGALKQSHVGVAVTDDTGFFTPSCDAILQGSQLPALSEFLQLARQASTIVKLCFIISFLYNVVGLSFAISGHLTPLVAAILMPASSITVVSFTSAAVWFVSRNFQRPRK